MQCVHGLVDSSLTLQKIFVFLFFYRELGQVQCATNLVHLAVKTFVADHTVDKMKVFIGLM